MVKPVDISKFRKSVTKGIEGISEGFNDPVTWLSTGCYALDYLISGYFDRGVPLEGKCTMLAGASGSGKSYIASANIVKNAQAKGIMVVVVDTENALDEAWLQALGVDTSEDKLMKINASMIDDVGKFISNFVKEYKGEYSKYPAQERPGVLFVVDSLGMLLTPVDRDQFERGDMKGDMGRKAKQLTALVRNIVSIIASDPIGLIVTNHTYASQDMFSPDDVISGGKGLEYACSIIVTINKLKLKEDASGNKVSDVTGIRAATQVRKSRYSKPFEKIEIKIPWDTGMDPYSGLFELFEKKGLITKEGNRYSYTSPNGDVFKDFRKNYGPEILDRMMLEFSEPEQPDTVGFDLETGEILEEAN